MPLTIATPAPEIPIRNAILGALMRSEYRRLVARMQAVALKPGQVLYRANEKIEHVYFPENSVIAMVETMDDGRTVEVGAIGYEGMVGINIFLGGVATPDRAIVQLGGGAMRMEVRDLRKEMRFGSPLQRLLLHYTQVFVAVLSQSVACCQYHSIEERLARWILNMNYYAGGEFFAPHAFIASMLGARRSGVSIAAARLKDFGLIDYNRGRIRVLDPHGLGRKSCECYAYVREQYDGLRASVPKLVTSGSGLMVRPSAPRPKRPAKS